LREPPYTALPSLVSGLAESLHLYLDKPYALFGHSMGAVIGFELARQMRRREQQTPLCLFVSGRRAPQLPCHIPPTYNLPEPEFVEMLRGLNGTPQEVLENAEMMRLMIPALRADFQVIQTYHYAAESPLDCPIIAFGGDCDEDATPEQMQAWRAQTNADFMLRTLPGGHFFLHTAQSLLLRLLAQELYQLVRILV
jgi:medium-chain acyl-[acyl-carrier-protein] hydrolase